MTRTESLWCSTCEIDVNAKIEEAGNRYDENTTEVFVCPICDNTLMDVGEFDDGARER